VSKKNLKAQKAEAHAQLALQLFGFNYACLLALIYNQCESISSITEPMLKAPINQVGIKILTPEKTITTG